MTIRNNESATQIADGCVRCHRHWPTASFQQFNEAVARGDDPEYICDLCLEFAPDDVSPAIDEAQSGEKKPGGLQREVKVTGVESKSNMVAFRYLTHDADLPLAFTDLYVEFKNGSEYVYRNLPTVVCEGMIAAPSRGAYFAEQIRSSYQSEKIS